MSLNYSKNVFSSISFLERIKNTLIVFVFFIFPAVLLLLGSIDIELKLSFWVNLCLVSMLLWGTIVANDTNLGNLFVIIFFYLFFLVAPIIQLSSRPAVLVNTLPYNSNLLFVSNVIISLFILAYSIGYFIMRSSIFRLKNDLFSKRNIVESGQKESIVLIVLIFLSFLACIFAIEEMMNKTSLLYLLENAGFEEDISDIMIRKKILYNIPLSAFVYLISIKKIKYRSLFLVLCLVLIFITKNPLLERRNGLGATYFLIFYYFIESYVKTSRGYFLIFFLTFLVFFPLSSILTHSSAFGWFSGLNNIDFGSIILEHFEQLHYDAWSNLAATIEYTQIYGYKFGYQLVGAILFFFPRSIWMNKPQATGAEVGNYLISEHNMWFNNLSSPLPAEAYIDFGILGVIVYALFFAILSVYLGRISLKSNSRLCKYTAIYVSMCYMFILRGALMPAVAYTVGAVVTLLVIPKLLEYIFRLVRFRL